MTRNYTSKKRCKMFKIMKENFKLQFCMKRNNSDKKENDHFPGQEKCENPIIYQNKTSIHMINYFRLKCI